MNNDEVSTTKNIKNELIKKSYYKQRAKDLKATFCSCP